MHRRTMVLGFAAIALLGGAAAGQAQVSVNIGINLPAPPSLVIIPSTPVAYAPAAPANVFFYGGQYYVFTNDVWYLGPTHHGPWAVVAPAFVPVPILMLPVRYYRVPPPHWKHVRRDAPPPWGPGWGHEWEKANKEYEKEWKKAEKEEEKEWKRAQKEEEKEWKEERKAMKKAGKK